MTDDGAGEGSGGRNRFVRMRNSIWGSLVAKEEGRERFSSRIAFFFAAVGSAVGFGNVWRFPQLAADYGGGAFFIPYVMALFLIGIPILFLEIALGQYHQTGDVGVFGSIHKRLRGVGLMSVTCSFMLVCYYTMLLAWVVHAFFDSFKAGNPWKQESVTGGDAVGYFLMEIIGMSTLGDQTRPTRVVGANVGYSFLVWFLIYLCVAWGLKWTGRITYFTMGLPILLLFIFLGRAVSLPGSEDGIHKYIGIWDMSVLVNQPDVWSTAVAQIFFSLSVTFGVMTAYGSHVKEDEPAFTNSCVIAISNCLFSFISGFAVFAAMGHLAYLLPDATVDDVDYSSFSLVFGTWPVVLFTLPGGIHWVRLLFFDLFLLGIDSAFSLLEGLLTVLRDSVRFQHTSKKKIAGVTCLLAWLVGIMYATDAGLFFLDVIDFYINFVMLLVGLFETFAVGWIYGLEETIKNLGKTVVIMFMFANFGSVIIACGLWFGLKSDSAVWAGFIALIGFYLIQMYVILKVLERKIKAEPETWGWRTIIHELMFRNVFDLKKELEPTVGRVPVSWCILIKHVIPHLLLILFINLARSKTDTGESMFGHYGGYITWPYQVLGILCVVFVLIIFLVGAAAPNAYACLQLNEEKLSQSVKPSTKDDHFTPEDEYGVEVEA